MPTPQPATSRPVLLLALAAACGTGPSDPPAIGAMVVLADSTGAADTSTTDAALWRGPQMVFFGDTSFQLDAVVTVNPGFRLQLVLQGDQFVAVPRRATYPVGATATRAIFAALTLGGVDYAADSGSIQVEKLGQGVLRWTVALRFLDPQAPAPPAYRLTAAIVASHAPLPPSGPAP